jgi:hypothetical protein
MGSLSQHARTVEVDLREARGLNFEAVSVAGSAKSQKTEANRKGGSETAGRSGQSITLSSFRRRTHPWFSTPMQESWKVERVVSLLARHVVKRCNMFVTVESKKKHIYPPL